MLRNALIPILDRVIRPTVRIQLLVKNGYESHFSKCNIKSSRSFVSTTYVRFSAENSEKVNFEFVKQIIDKNGLIIDVREPDELKEHGILPGSINIPLGNVQETLQNFSNDQFQDKYGCPKPDERTLIIFSCMKGMRSEKAQIIAQQLGYKNVKNYYGGWIDWAQKNNNCSK